MNIIIIRGLPGSGKTEIADRLSRELKIPVLHIDYLKTQIMKDFPGQYSWNEIRAKAYDQALNYLADLNKKGTESIICEELLADKDFAIELQNFCSNAKIKIYSFKIERNIEKLLELENSPERVARPRRNTREDLDELNRKINEIIIPNEIVIENNGEVSETLSEIKILLARERPARELFESLGDYRK